MNNIYVRGILSSGLIADPEKQGIGLSESNSSLSAVLAPKPDPSPPTPLEIEDWMQEKKHLQESGLLSRDSDLDSCSFSSSAFRPFTSKLSDYITLHASKRLKQQQRRQLQQQQQQQQQSLEAVKETSCSEVSTTVDKDDPPSLQQHQQQQQQQQQQIHQQQLQTNSGRGEKEKAEGIICSSSLL